MGPCPGRMELRHRVMCALGRSPSAPGAVASHSRSFRQVPLPAFCLVVLTVDEVDWLSLKTNRRFTWKQSDEDWAMSEVNP